MNFLAAPQFVSQLAEASCPLLGGQPISELFLSLELVSNLCGVLVVVGEG
jgi:hypothetical protein